MHEKTPTRWERALADCPHCGRTVLFDAAGVCPSCQIRGDAEVTEQDRERIEADRAAPLRTQDVPPGDASAGFWAGAAFRVVLRLFGFMVG